MFFASTKPAFHKALSAIGGGRKALFLASLLLALLPGLNSCKKAPYLSLSGPNSFSFTNAGGTQSITFATNRDWRISSSAPWCRISPSSGAPEEGEITVSLNCEKNTTYDPRECTLTIRVEDLTETIQVSQETNYGLFVSPGSFQLTDAAQTIEVEVKSNVSYTVSIDAGQPAWISRTTTKALASDKLVFTVLANTSFDDREGTITIKQSGGDLVQVISVKQQQRNALAVSTHKVDLACGRRVFYLEVKHNISFDVLIPAEASDWVSYIPADTKGLESDKLKFLVQENQTYDARSTEITLKQTDGDLTVHISVIQAGRVPVTSVTLNKTSLSIHKGDTYTLKATVKPDNATDKDISWESDTPYIATVDENGTVTALRSGSAGIIAFAGGKSARCDVTVTVPVSGITLSPQTLTLEQNTSRALDFSISPEDATEQGITWKSSNPSVASVSDGEVKAILPGKATITATTVDGGFSASTVVTVEEERTRATSISFPGNALFVSPGKSYLLKAAVEPADAVCDFTWSCSTSAFTLNEDGAQATIQSNYASLGNTLITLKDARSGLSATLIAYSFVQGFTWEESSADTYAGFPLITIAPGTTHQLKYYSDAGGNVLNLFGDSDQFVFYHEGGSSYSSSAISLSPDGLVTGLLPGIVGIKPTGYIQAGGNRVYIKVADRLYEKEYNDTQDYANTVPYGIPMDFYLGNTSDVDWFKLMPATNQSGMVSVTISVKYSGAGSLKTNEGRLCKYSLYDSSMQLWGSGTFMFSNGQPVATTDRTVPNGPLYLKVYFDTSHTSALLPSETMTVQLSVN